MRISEMINTLEYMKKQYGDLPITTIDTTRLESKPYYLKSNNFGITAIIDGKENRFLLMIKE